MWPPIIILNKGQLSFSVKGPVVKIFGSVGHTDSQNH